MVFLGFTKVLYVFQLRLGPFDIFLGGIQVSSVNPHQASMAFIGFGECSELGVTLWFLNFFPYTLSLSIECLRDLAGPNRRA